MHVYVITANGRERDYRISGRRRVAALVRRVRRWSPGAFVGVNGRVIDPGRAGVATDLNQIISQTGELDRLIGRIGPHCRVIVDVDCRRYFFFDDTTGESSPSMPLGELLAWVKARCGPAMG